MDNKKRLKILLILLAIIIIVVLFGLKTVQNNKNSNIKDDQTINTDILILGNSNDLISFSVEPGQEVKGILTTVGSVSGGYFFEGNIQVNILDHNKKVLRSGNGNAKTDWMTSGPVGFEAILDFTKLRNGKAYIEIHNDNASGLPENDKSILVPIIINN